MLARDSAEKSPPVLMTPAGMSNAGPLEPFHALGA
jgi:hypothetical protein